MKTFSSLKLRGWQALLVAGFGTALAVCGVAAVLVTVLGTAAAVAGGVDQSPLGVIVRIPVLLAFTLIIFALHMLVPAVLWTGVAAVFGRWAFRGGKSPRFAALFGVLFAIPAWLWTAAAPAPEALGLDVHSSMRLMLGAYGPAAGFALAMLTREQAQPPQPTVPNIRERLPRMFGA